MMGQGGAGHAAAFAKLSDGEALMARAHQAAQNREPLFRSKRRKGGGSHFEGDICWVTVFHISKNIEISESRKPYFEYCRNKFGGLSGGMSLRQEIQGCQICADRFAATATGHVPRPVVWFEAKPKLLIVGQAPGARVHESGRPFTDPSGDRLRDWMGVDEADFYDTTRVAIVPMAFCFPGYNATGSDLPPPPVCAKIWRKRVMDVLGDVPLTLVVGGYAQKWHLGTKAGVTDTVQAWHDHAPTVFPLPHPSWRNTAWLKKNPWFEAELLPVLQTRIKEVLT